MIIFKDGVLNKPPPAKAKVMIKRDHDDIQFSRDIDEESSEDIGRVPQPLGGEVSPEEVGPRDFEEQGILFRPLELERSPRRFIPEHFDYQIGTWMPRTQRSNVQHAKDVERLVTVDPLNLITGVRQGQVTDPFTGMPRVFLQPNIGGLRPGSDQEADQLIDSLQDDIIASTAIMFSEESWIKAMFTESQIRRCTLSINRLPQVFETGTVNREAMVRTVHTMVMRMVTCDHLWPAGHTGLLGFRCHYAWDKQQCSQYFTGQVWILFSSTEIMLRVKEMFNGAWAFEQREPLLLMSANDTFIWTGPRSRGHLLSPNGSASQSWTGDQVWRGFELGQTMRGSLYWSCYDRAQWEKFVHNFLIEQGFDPVAVIGDPEYLDLWKVGL